MTHGLGFLAHAVVAVIAPPLFALQAVRMGACWLLRGHTMRRVPAWQPYEVCARCGWKRAEVTP